MDRNQGVPHAPESDHRPRLVDVTGRHGGDDDGSQPRPQTSRARPATDAQIRAIHAIASKANVVLASELDTEFGVASPQSLTLQQASEMIEKLKGQLTGQ